MTTQARPLILILLIALVTPLTVVAYQNFTISKIEFEGLKRLTPEEVIATTSLKLGDRFALSSLDAAAQQLMDSGHFNKVAYKTRVTRQEMTITFLVEEATITTSRVIFDNFIWFSDPELIGAVRRDLPSFTGTAPDTGDTVDRIVKSLQRFLHENKIEATVTYMVSQDSVESQVQEHIFSVNGVPMPICSLHFPGAKNIEETRLIEGAKELKSNEYSRKFVSSFAGSNLLELYREVGRLKAVFAPPSAKPEATANCKSGVELTIPVDEGAIYKWDRAEWSGNNVLTTEELNAVLQMQSGQPANGVKLDNAPNDIKKAYGRKGHLLARVSSQPEFDDAAHTVVYKLNVVEGPQFRMGQFITRGFSETETKELKSRWALKAGEVFDDGYSGEFSKKHFREVLGNNVLRRQAEGKPAPNLKWGSKVNREARTVDVTLELTN